MIAALVLPAAPSHAGPRDGQIVIESNAQFDAAHGVRSGTGTKAHPYVIEDWNLSRLEIHDTSKHVIIRNNIIGTLRLNWIGDGVTVVKNRINDLRVNENVRRTGDATDGRIAHNQFSIVGQLRHFDGVFAHNKVGAPREESQCCDLTVYENNFRAVNFDGFNGAVFKNNTIYGYVEARLHGHHHSSEFGGESHYHGSETPTGGVDHMRRYHEVTIRNNTIYNDGPYGLVWTDTNHAANDRTAESEQNPELNNPHEHFTHVTIANNTLVGSGIFVDVFNADDPHHLRTNTGMMTIRGNKITLHEYRDTANLWDSPPMGIAVWQAQDLHLIIEDNQILGPEQESASMDPVSDTVWNQVPSAIQLESIEKAWIHIIDNTVTNRDVGIYARSFRDVHWWISDFEARGVTTRMDYDNSSNSPHEQP
jgi:hypothetical protein